MVKCQRALIFIDQISKVIPVFSTVTSLVDLFEKHVALRNKDVTGNRYYEHIKKQSSWISIGVSIPILGNLGYIFYRIFIYFKNKEKPVEIEVLKEDIPDLDPIIEPIVIEEIIEPKEPRPLSETFNEFLNLNLRAYICVLNKEKLNALFDLDEDALNQQGKALEGNEGDAPQRYTILENIYLLDLIKESGELRGDEIYVIEHSQLNEVPKFKEAVEKAYEEQRKLKEREEREERVKKEKRNDCTKILNGFLEIKTGHLFEYLASLTQNDLDHLYQLDQLLKDSSQLLFTQSEIEEMAKKIEENERVWLFKALINICNGLRSGKLEKTICEYLLIEDIKIVGQGQSFISEPIEDLEDEKEDLVEEGFLSVNSYQEKLNKIKLESNKKIEELKQDWKQLFDFKKSKEQEKEKECKEKIALLVNEEKEKAKKLLEENWSKNEKWEDFDLIVGENEEKSSIEPVVMEMIRTEQDFLNKLSKFKIFLEKLPENERWNDLIKNIESIIEHSEAMEKNLSSAPSWKSVLEGFEPNRVKELFMALRSFEAQAHELRKILNQDLDSQEDIKIAIRQFIEEIGEEESRKIGIGNAGIFSSIMGNLLMAPIQRSMRYRLTFQEFLKNAMQHQKEFPLMYAATERRLQALVLLCATLNLLHPSN